MTNSEYIQFRVPIDDPYSVFIKTDTPLTIIIDSIPNLDSFILTGRNNVWQIRTTDDTTHIMFVAVY